ncbi:atpH [Symbiodinium natans]|uniref:AtpH protein n=1 Tax=Symbiodinium natans TaxID=878477 RepID=A0A812RVA3_9DINO|nr:atpH [Symbiodinium natans]
MGCGASSSRSSSRRRVVCHVPKTFLAPPTDAFPPDRDMHELHVRKLNAYLSRVKKNPRAFEKKVDKRRAESLGGPSDPWPMDAVPRSTVPMDAVLKDRVQAVPTQTSWLNVGP